MSHNRTNPRIARRSLLQSGAALGGMIAAGLPLHRALAAAPAEALPTIKVWKDPNCGCCTGWAEHLRGNGFTVTVVDTAAMQAIKARFGVPPEFASCHTAEIGSYVIEGHVPAHAIKRLIVEQPAGRGLAVPGMPVGSPGMEGGIPELYEVILFGTTPSLSFGRYKGHQPT